MSTRATDRRRWRCGASAARAEAAEGHRPRSIRFASRAAPEGLKTFHVHHHDAPVYTPPFDGQLNEHGWIIAGLGDAGDRLFGTR